MPVLQEQKPVIKKAGQTHKMAHTGSITLIHWVHPCTQPFRAYAKIHSIYIYLDNVYIETRGATRFRWVKAPTSAELTHLKEKAAAVGMSPEVRAPPQKNLLA